MQDNDRHDQAHTQDSDKPQIIGGSWLFADEKEHATDQPQADGSTLIEPLRDDHLQQSSEIQCSSGAELIEILSGVEQQIERLRGLHLTHENKLNSIAQRSRALEDAEKSFDSDNSSLKKLEENLEERANELQSQQQHLADQQSEQEQEQEILEQERVWLKQVREELEELQEAAKSEIQSQRQHLADQQAELDHQQEALKREQTQLTQQQEDAEIELESLKEHRVVIKQRQEALADEEHQQEEQRAAMHAEIEQTQLDIKSQQEDFNKEREDFNKEREVLLALRLENENQTASFLEREVEFQQNQIELDQKQQRYIFQQRTLEQELENLQCEKDTFKLNQAELDKLRSEYESKQSELQQQVENASDNCRELEDQIRSLKSELDERDRVVNELTLKFQQQDPQLQERFCALQEESNLLEEKLKDQESQILAHQQAAATIKQQQEQIEQFKKELADIRIKADPQLMQRKDERIEELVEALHQARGQIGGEQSIDESEARVQQLLSENEMLRIQLERASIDTGNDKQTSEALTEVISTTAPADESGPVGEEINALQAEVQLLHLQTDVQACQNINDESEKISNILRPSDSNEFKLDDCGQQDNFRGAEPLSPANLQAPIENTVTVPPQSYLKRKAGPVKIITTLGWLTVASVIIAGASWLAANHYFPATVSASVIFKAGSQSIAALTTEQKQQWQEWHTNLLTNADFTSMLSNRLAARRLDQYADVNILRIHLAENLAVDLAQADAITLTLAGTNKNELTVLLDTLASTFISESDESLKDNSAGLKTHAVGTRKQGNQVLYASLNPTPILDERIKYASFMFAVGFAGAVVLVSVISRRPIRSTDIFTDSDPVFVTPQR